nr:hypothetical protein Iba_chr04bCG19680 [Ipomoea batatas]
MKTSSSFFLFANSAMDSNSLSKQTLRSSGLDARRAFLFSSNNFSYSSRVISYQSGSFTSGSSDGESFLASPASSCPCCFSIASVFTTSLTTPFMGSSASGAISSVGLPQFPRPEPSRLISLPRPVPLRRSYTLRGYSPSAFSPLLRSPRRSPRKPPLGPP